MEYIIIYINIPVHERICQICENNVIEDELHVLINCRAYNNMQNQLSMSLSESNIWELFNSKEEYTIKLLGNYVWKINEKRTSLLD